MNENKFSPRAEEVLRLSQEAAEEMGHGYVGSEHLLLGLLREEEGIAHKVLAEYGLTDEMVCSILQRSVGKGLSGIAPSQGLTPRAKGAVELAVSEAARTGAGYIGTEHLLMGILRENDGLGAKVLRSSGLDESMLSELMEKEVGRGTPDAPLQGLTPRCKRAFELSAADAARLGQSYVGTEHLLLGIVLEKEGYEYTLTEEEDGMLLCRVATGEKEKDGEG